MKHLNKPNLELLAEVIGIAESNANDAKEGANGERGRYQFQDQLWRQISALPFVAAHDPHVAKRAMLRHLEWLCQRLRNFQSLEHSGTYIVALGWTAGPQAVLYLFANQGQKDRANLLEAYYNRKIEAQGERVTHHCSPGNNS